MHCYAIHHLTNSGNNFKSRNWVVQFKYGSANHIDRACVIIDELATWLQESGIDHQILGVHHFFATEEDMTMFLLANTELIAELSQIVEENKQL